MCRKIAAMGSHSTGTAVQPDGWDGKAIGLLDLDAFFASVEQLDHPEWRGRPVIVGGSPEERGVVSTASYEARTFGVHSAMPSYQAARLCPQAIWARPRHERYSEVSRQVMALIAEETPFVEQVSIDEAFFDISPGRYSREDPVGICRRLQERVSALGVSCSIGLSTSKSVAKVASERQKPRGLTVVSPGTERDFLSPLPVGALSGIGQATAAHLSHMGIRTLGQLASQDEQLMQREFGVIGPSLVRRAAGCEDSPVRALDEKEPALSVSVERTFAHDLTTQRDVVAAIWLVGASLATRLRRKGLSGWRLTLKLKFSRDKTRTCQCQLDDKTDDEHVFCPEAERMLEKIWHEGVPVRLVGLSLGGFHEERARQLELFPETGKPAPREDDTRNLRALSVATDEVKSRFGEGAIGLGREYRLRDS